MRTLDVHAGAKGLLASTGDDADSSDRAVRGAAVSWPWPRVGKLSHLRFLVHPVPEPVHLPRGLEGERVHLRRAVDGRQQHVGRREGERHAAQRRRLGIKRHHPDGPGRLSSSSTDAGWWSSCAAAVMLVIWLWRRRGSPTCYVVIWMVN